MNAPVRKAKPKRQFTVVDNVPPGYVVQVPQDALVVWARTYGRKLIEKAVERVKAQEAASHGSE